MKHEIKHLPKSLAQIKVTVPSEKMEEYRKKATAEISKDVNVKGFRPGHVPPEVLKQHVDEKYITAQTQKLENKNFAERAPKDIIAKERVRLEESKVEFNKLKKALDELA